MPEEKRSELEVLINMGHGQDPFTNAYIHAHPCIVLQLERFLPFELKREIPMDFFRILSLLLLYFILLLYYLIY